MKVLTAIAMCAVAAAAQGTETKEKAEDYPVHGRAGDLAIGAEYMVRTVLAERTSFLTGDYLVVEVALFPPPHGTTVAANEWILRIDGKKAALLAQTPGMVGASLKYPNWSQTRGVVAQAGPLIIGPPAPVERFPGDNRPAQQRRPGPVPRVPDDDQKPEIETVDPVEAIERTALPEGPRRQPVSGYLFFPFKGRADKLKSVELIYQEKGSDQPLVLRLR